MAAGIQIGRKNRHLKTSSTFPCFGGGEGNVKRYFLKIFPVLHHGIGRRSKNNRTVFFNMIVRIDNRPRAFKPLLRPLDALGNLAQSFFHKSFQIHHFKSLSFRP